MAKLLKIASTTPNLFIKLDDGKESWIHCSDSVKAEAQKNFKLGDDISYTLENNLITKIMKGGPGTVQQPGTVGSGQAVQTPGGGNTVTASLKTEDKVSTYRYPMSPDEQRAIRRQSIMGYTCTAVTTSTGQAPVDPDQLAEYIIKIYRKLLKEVEG